tara:strand:+ start:76 stop:363 length:288 start_codon:yes stop_codon:yes gene_type:complete
MMNSKYDKLIDLLKYHDWTYEYSDDNRAYEWGYNNKIEIDRELERLGRDDQSLKIYEDAKPDYLKESSFINSGSQHLPMSSEDDDWDNKFEWKIK